MMNQDLRVKERIADTVKSFLRSLTGGKDKEEEIVEEQPIIETDESQPLD